MAITTTSLGIHKPDANELLANGFDAIADVADDVNALVVADRARLTALEADLGWVDLSLPATVVIQAGQTPAVRKLRGNHVFLRGLVKSSTSWAATTTYSLLNTALAATYRPVQARYFQVAGSNANADARVNINSDGTLQLTTGTTAPAYIDLTSIWWLTD